MSARSDAPLDRPASTRVDLRPLRPSDRPAVQLLLEDRPLQHVLLAFPPEGGVPEVDRWMERRKAGGELICFAIADEKDRFCGFVQISGWHKRGRFGWLGMALLPERRSQGLGRLALQDLIERAGRDFGKHEAGASSWPVRTTQQKSNVRSNRLR